MRNILWILVAVVVAVGAYWLYTGQAPNAVDVDQVETPADVDPVVDEPVEETATVPEPATDEDAADLTPQADTAEDAATIEEPAAEDAAPAQEPATDATEDAATAEEPATEPAADATVTDDAADTTEADTGEAATDTAAAGDPQEMLTVDGFDFEGVNEMIENSDLEPTQKALLTSSLEQAQDDPNQLEEILAQIREALDL